MTSNSTIIFGSLPLVSILAMVPWPNLLCKILHPWLISLSECKEKSPLAAAAGGGVAVALGVAGVNEGLG